MSRPRILVLGATGMLGHRLCWTGRQRDDIEVWGTTRATLGERPVPAEVLDDDHHVAGVDARDSASWARALDAVRPDVVINAIGAVKQRPDGQDPEQAMAVNAELPHALARATISRGVRMLHISTDCVFDGARGAYAEDDRPDATDLYGRAKALGEPTGPGVLVVRTSMIGRELQGAAGLLEWFLAAASPVSGYRRARFSGLTTAVLADVLLDLAARDDALEGLFHVAGPAIDKASLLALLAPALRPDVSIEVVDEPVIDRTLDGRRFADAIEFAAPSWEQMVDGLAAEAHLYDHWRSA